MVDITKVKAAFKRAGYIALTGTQEQRSGRFLPQEKKHNQHQTFTIELHKTYYNMGFFNVSVQHEHLFGSDGEELSIFLQDQRNHPLIGHINRTANQNHTPRIMGTKHLRDWFQNNFSMNDLIKIVILSKNEIIITET